MALMLIDRCAGGDREDEDMDDTNPQQGTTTVNQTIIALMLIYHRWRQRG